MKKFLVGLIVVMLVVGGLGCDDSTIKPGVKVLDYIDLSDKSIDDIPSEKVQDIIQSARYFQSGGGMRYRPRNYVPEGEIQIVMYAYYIGSSNRTNDLKSHIFGAVTADKFVEKWLEHVCKYPWIEDKNNNGVVFVVVDDDAYVDQYVVHQWFKKKIQKRR